MIRPVILCGGAGTRLLPLSRQLFPKQLLPLMGQQSLLQETAVRLTGGEFTPALVVSSEDQRFFIKRQLADAGLSPEGIILEPAARNTSAAAALAAAWLHSTGRDELLLLVPSDHIIRDRAAFLHAVRQGASHAEAGAIVTFGAKPTEPNTQYGYIEAGPAQGSTPVLPIKRFVEKPDAANAAEYLATGRFYWNTGIFLLKAGTLLEQMQQFLPESLHAITDAVANATTDDVFIRPQSDAFNRATNISSDHGIMEKTSRGMVVPVEMDWSDVGSWDAVWKLEAKDANNNVTRGEIVALDTRSSLLRSEEGGPLVTALGLDQIAIIATDDAVFVSPLDRVSEVKQIVERLKEEGRDCVISPSMTGQAIAGQPRFQVEYMTIEPGDCVAQGKHASGSAHWIVVRGEAEVMIGEQVSMLYENQTTFIPAQTDHRLANISKAPLELLEIRWGSDPVEDDIKRIEN